MSQQCQAFMKKVDRKCKKSAKKGELFCFMHISDKISTNVEKQKLGLSMISDEKKIVLTEVDNKDEVSAGVGGLTTDELKIEIKDKTTDELKTGVGIDGKNKIETEIKDKGENKNKLYFDPKNIAISLEYYKKFVDDKTFIFIEKAIKVHGTRFDYTECKYVHSKTDVKIRCMIHGPYDQAPTTHLEGKKCRLCGNIEGGKKNKRKITTEQYIERCEKFHGKDKYDYSMTVYEAASKDVIIICKIHGPFSQRASTHYTSNCPDCVIEDNRKSDRKLTTAIFIERSKKVHGDRYDYSHADYVNCRTPVEVKCRLHDVFLIYPPVHMAGSGCPVCKELSTTSFEEFIKLSKEIHGEKYEYIECKYVNLVTSVDIMCKFHNDTFSVRPCDHIYGYGCVKCTLCPSCFTTKSQGNLCQVCIDKNTDSGKHKKTKEEEVVRFLEENLTEEKMIINKSVGDIYTLKHLYPDIRFPCGKFQLVVEIDEFEHKAPAYTCELQRMYDIIAKLNSPCIFIRYNPDSNKSDKNVLLQKVKEYLSLKDNSDIGHIFDNFGLKVEYLFYTKIKN
jgi:hypothetical protein